MQATDFAQPGAPAWERARRGQQICGPVRERAVHEPHPKRHCEHPLKCSMAWSAHKFCTAAGAEDQPPPEEHRAQEDQPLRVDQHCHVDQGLRVGQHRLVDRHRPVGPQAEPQQNKTSETDARSTAPGDCRRPCSPPAAGRSARSCGGMPWDGPAANLRSASRRLASSMGEQGLIMRSGRDPAPYGPPATSRGRIHGRPGGSLPNIATLGHEGPGTGGAAGESGSDGARWLQAHEGD